MLILVINPGSTSTKVALFNEHLEMNSETIRHPADELLLFNDVVDQLDFRYMLVSNLLIRWSVKVDDLDIVIGRGGFLFPLASGVYRVNELMKQQLSMCVNGEHPCNLGALIADKFREENPKIEALIADPVVVDEMIDIARYTGHPLFERKSFFHALNQKAVARRFAKESEQPYDEINLVTVHLGGGITVGAHRKGKVIDVNNGLDGEGPFSTERAGSIPFGQLINLCFDGKYSRREVYKMLVGGGGMMAYFGTNDFRMLSETAKTDEKTKMLIEAYVYNIVKWIGSMFFAINDNVDAIIITGGVAYNEEVVAMIKNYVERFAKVIVYPGEDEMEALYHAALAANKGELEILEYDKLG